MVTLLGPKGGREHNSKKNQSYSPSSVWHGNHCNDLMIMNLHMFVCVCDIHLSSRLWYKAADVCKLICESIQQEARISYSDCRNSWYSSTVTVVGCSQYCFCTFNRTSVVWKIWTYDSTSDTASLQIRQGCQGRRSTWRPICIVLSVLIGIGFVALWCNVQMKV